MTPETDSNLNEYHYTTSKSNNQMHYSSAKIELFEHRNDNSYGLHGNI